METGGKELANTKDQHKAFESSSGSRVLTNINVRFCKNRAADSKAVVAFGRTTRPILTKSFSLPRANNQEPEEIKKLRKSLTFKARPLPGFYREPPPPPKVELKKIPITRAVSPKLGRQRSIGTKEDGGAPREGTNNKVIPSNADRVFDVVGSCKSSSTKPQSAQRSTASKVKCHNKKKNGTLERSAALLDQQRPVEG